MPHALACPGCLKRFAWTPKLAGRRVTCHCGQKFVAPDAPGGPVVPIYETGPKAPEKSKRPPRETYDLASDDDPPPRKTKADTPKPRHDGKCPGCNAPLKPDAVVCVRCGFNVTEGQRIKTDVAKDAPPPTEEAVPEARASDAPGPDPLAFGSSPIARALAAREDELKPSRARERYVPTAMISLACLGLPVVSWWGTKSLGEAAWHLLQNAGVALLSTLAIFGALAASLNFITLSLGNFRSTLLKIIAVGMLGSLAADLATILIIPMVVDAVVMGVMAAMVVMGLVCIAITLNVIFVGLPMLYLFELDFPETGAVLICVVLLKAVGIPVVLILAGVI